MSKSLTFYALCNEENELVWTGECCSQLEGSDFDGVAFWQTKDEAEDTANDHEMENVRVVKVTLSVSTV